MSEEMKTNSSAPKGPMGRGPMGGGHGHGPGPAEKAKNFKGSIKKLLAYIGSYKAAVLVVMIFAVASTVFNVLGPKVMGKATTALAEIGRASCRERV